MCETSCFERIRYAKLHCTHRQNAELAVDIQSFHVTNILLVYNSTQSQQNRPQKWLQPIRKNDDENRIDF